MTALNPRRLRSGLVAVAALTAATAFQAAPARATSGHAGCSGWTVRVVASGLGSLENLLPSPAGIYLSATDRKAVLLLRQDRRTVTVAAPVTAPGGLALRSGHLLFNTGNAAASGATDTPDGTIRDVDLKTGRAVTWASGLTMPNGLALLPDGSAVVSRVLHRTTNTGITRIARRGARPAPNWSRQADSNGLFVSPDGKWLYADETFTAPSNLYRIPISRPDRPQLVARLAESPAGPSKGLDDLTVASSGAVYVAANVAGQVIRVDPQTGRHCVIATGLSNPSSVRQGAGGAFPRTTLYVVGFDGRLLALAPPRGLTP